MSILPSKALRAATANKTEKCELVSRASVRVIRFIPNIYESVSNCILLHPFDRLGAPQSCDRYLTSYFNLSILDHILILSNVQEEVSRNTGFNISI